MNALRKLEDVTPNKPYLGFAKLSRGYHQILSFRIVKNKFGKKGDGSSKSIIIELRDQVYAEDIRELNEDIQKKNEAIFIYFGGRDEKTK